MINRRPPSLDPSPPPPFPSPPLLSHSQPRKNKNKKTNGERKKNSRSLSPHHNRIRRLLRPRLYCTTNIPNTHARPLSDRKKERKKNINPLPTLGYVPVYPPAYSAPTHSPDRHPKSEPLVADRVVDVGAPEIIPSAARRDMSSRIGRAGFVARCSSSATKPLA